MMWCPRSTTKLADCLFTICLASKLGKYQGLVEVSVESEGKACVEPDAMGFVKRNAQTPSGLSAVALATERLSIACVLG